MTFRFADENDCGRLEWACLDCTMDSLKTDNRKVINGFQHAAEQVVLIDSSYEQTIKALLN